MLSTIEKAVEEIKAKGFDAKIVQVNLRESTGKNTHGISVKVAQDDERIAWKTVQSKTTQVVDGKLVSTPCEVQTPAGFLFSRAADSVFLSSGLLDSEHAVANFTESFTKLNPGELVQGWMKNNATKKPKP